MPLYSDLTNSSMYYSGMPSYSSGSSYGYSGSSLPLGVSFSASYLNPGGSYSTHSSLGGYGRTPLSSRWISNSRAYSPMLSTISERGTASPMRINSPRRIPLTNKSYSSTSYSPRPININTADIDVSRDKYRTKHTLSRPHISPTSSVSSNSKQGTNDSSNDNSPFMPRVDGKPETGIDSSPGQRSTIHRGRAVVRLYTVKRKEKDSPRKAQEVESSLPKDKVVDLTSATETPKTKPGERKIKSKNKLSENVIRNDKNQSNNVDEKITERFKPEEETNTRDLPVKNDCSDQKNIEQHSENSSVLSSTVPNTGLNRSPDRRCSMELLAEQAHLLDSLIRNENLSTATLDLSKLGTKDDKSQIFNFSGNTNEKSVHSANRLQTTKSDHSLHNRLRSSLDSKETQQFPKRRSLKKSSSGGNIRRLDSITEFAKESIQRDLPVIEENRLSCKLEKVKIKLKSKPKITSSVDTSQPISPLKFRVENITVEEKIKIPKKEIIFSSEVDIPKDESKLFTMVIETMDEIPKKISSKSKKPKSHLEKKGSSEDNAGDCDFWDKIGKRETIYIKKRKEKIQDDILKHRQEIFWSPGEDTADDKIEQDSDSTILSQESEENSLKNSDSILYPTEKCAGIDFRLSNNKTICGETTNPEHTKKEKFISLGCEKEKQSDSIQSSSKNVVEDKTNMTKIDGTKLPNTGNAYVHLMQDQINVPHIKNDVRNEFQVLTSLEETAQENCVSPNIANEEIATEATSNLITEVDSNNSIDMSNQMSSASQVLQKEKIIHNKMKSVKRNSLNTTAVDIQSYRAKISIIGDPKTSHEKQPSNLTSRTTGETEKNITKDPVSLALEVQDGKFRKDLEGSKKINDTSKLDILPNSTVENIPNENSILNDNNRTVSEETGEINKADNEISESTNADHTHEKSQKCVIQLPPSPKKRIVKDQPASRPLIATPRPLQKKAPQIIHSSSSSESSSEEESSDEDDDADESDDSEESAQFFDCENNPDGRTSTGSNDSGFDSSAPTSPAGFVFIKKESSTAYGLFRKTGRFTPPARSIPRFRKYTIDDFHFIKVLGKGSFGKVLLAELRDTEYYYAVKCLKKDVVLEDDDVECTLIERKVLALGTNHPYLCHLFATFQTDSHLFFVMEYLNGGDLMFHIQQSGRFPEARARFYAAEIVSGLKFLHKRGIVYRDLKLDNILLDYEGHVRIADFGMCKLQIYLDKTADTFCGTPDYMAPEIIKGLKYNQAVDWWSFGVLLYEMLIGQSPFSGCDEDELFWSICNEMPSYPRFLSTEALTVLTRLLDKDACTRLGGAECMHGDIRDQDFFRPIPWDRLERRDLETPFKPRVRHPLDTQYFDRAFTGERPRLTAVEPQVLRSMDQEPFRGFSYTNPNATDR